jgi:hypothetical protein
LAEPLRLEIKTADVIGGYGVEIVVSIGNTILIEEIIRKTKIPTNIPRPPGWSSEYNIYSVCNLGELGASLAGLAYCRVNGWYGLARVFNDRNWSPP